MSLNYVTLILDLFDGSGNAISQGAATFTPSAQLTDSTDQELIPQAQVQAFFRAGLAAPQVTLLATDNANVLPSGWGWNVTFQNVPGSPAGFSFFLPFASGATQHLSKQAPVSSVVTMQAYLPVPGGTAAVGNVPAVSVVNPLATTWAVPLVNPMTTSGDTIYGGSGGAATRLAGDTSNVRKFLRELSVAGVAQVPAWDTIQAGDVPLDGTASDIQPGGVRAAGSSGLIPDARHVHPVSLWQPSDSGLLTWNFDPAIFVNIATLPAAGTLAVMAVKLGAAASITNIIMFVGSGGSSLTSGQCFAALYQGAGGALLGTTADQSGLWNAAGLKTMAISGGPVAAAAGVLYVAAWWNGTGSPSFKAGDTGASLNAGLPAANSRWGTANAGVTTAAPATLGAISVANSAWWVALS